MCQIQLRSSFPTGMVRIRILIRRRRVLAAILGTSVIYFTYKMLRLHGDNRVRGSNSVKLSIEESFNMRRVLTDFKWPIEKDNASKSKNNAVKHVRCRNSVQGRELLVDDQGYVCRRDDLTSRGCCDVIAIFTNRYACDTCSTSNCCSVYEHCVSCCMQPKNKSLVKKVILSAVSTNIKRLYAAAEDMFTFCIMKCRTSSASVQQENMYRDSDKKHCYGVSPPELHLQI